MEYLLKKGEVISLDSSADSVIKVKEGVIWLTFSDGERDYFLQKGRNFTLDSERNLVLEALTGSKFHIDCPATAGCQATIRLIFSAAYSASPSTAR